MILALSGIALIVAIIVVVFALCLAAAAKDEPRRGIRVGGFKPFANDAINRRLALGLKAQTSNKNKRK